MVMDFFFLKTESTNFYVDSSNPTNENVNPSAYTSSFGDLWILQYDSININTVNLNTPTSVVHCVYVSITGVVHIYNA